MTERARFGRTRIIVNPEAQSGAGAAAGERLARFLSLCLPEGDFEVEFTERPRHAVELAADAKGFDTVFALGGDGTVHEVANGLMRIQPTLRPALAVVPIGSGNDYARTLGIDDWHGTDFSGILSYRLQPMDVGRVRFSDEDGSVRTEHFVQTLSFGLDAAIALETHEVRQRVKLTGNALYMMSAARAFGRDYRTFPCIAAFDDEPARCMEPIVMALQIGPTYGSGFEICPDADPADGLLDVCYAEGPFPRVGAAGIFLMAKSGRHTGFKRIKMRRAARARFDLEGEHPVQADGEALPCRHLEVDVIAGGLTVYQPA